MADGEEPSDSMETPGIDNRVDNSSDAYAELKAKLNSLESEIVKVSTVSKLRDLELASCNGGIPPRGSDGTYGRVGRCFVLQAFSFSIVSSIDVIFTCSIFTQHRAKVYAALFPLSNFISYRWKA